MCKTICKEQNSDTTLTQWVPRDINVPVSGPRQLAQRVAHRFSLLPFPITHPFEPQCGRLEFFYRLYGLELEDEPILASGHTTCNTKRFYVFACTLRLTEFGTSGTLGSKGREVRLRPVVEVRA